MLTSPTRAWIVAALAFVLAAATVALYFPVHHYPFVSLNDAEYVTQNVRIQQLDWDSIVWSFTTLYAANWHPLTWLSHALDYHLFALAAGGHHLTNALLHALNAVLLFWVLWRATGYVGRSFMVAALFALHPINVESVAWIAERKNLLSMMFLLLALGAYRWYAARPRVGRYTLVLIFYVFGLMSKPQIITLPFLLLLWDYWPLERVACRQSLFAFRQKFAASISGEQRIANSEDRFGEQRSFGWLLLEKLPPLALSAASAVITVHAQRSGGAMGGALRSYSLVVRLENAVVCYARYLSKAIWPARLAFFYPHPVIFHLRQVAMASLLLLLLTAVAVALRRHRYLVVGWLWFLGSLVPMIGLLQVGGQAMADRYAYLSFVGLFIAFCWGVADWAKQRRLPNVCVAGASLALLLVLMVATHRQLTYWSSDLALWAHTAQVTGNNSAAENMVGESLQKAGRAQEAMEHFRNAAAIDPLLPYPHYHLGVYDEENGNPQDAILQFKRVIALTQSDTGVLAGLRANTFTHMASSYEATGDTANAERATRLASEEQHRDWSFETNTRP